MVVLYMCVFGGGTQQMITHHHVNEFSCKAVNKKLEHFGHIHVWLKLACYVTYLSGDWSIT